MLWGSRDDDPAVFRVAKLARAERSADFQDRDGGILLRPLFGSTLF
jgi:hypothetical protein